MFFSRVLVICWACLSDEMRLANVVFPQRSLRVVVISMPV